MLFSLIAGLTVSVQVLDARIDVTVGSDETVAAAEYEFASDTDEVVVHVIRLPGQSVSIISSSAPLEADSSPGLVRWRVVSGVTELAITYRVTGVRDRVPLVIPVLPAVPGETGVEILLRGSGVGRLLADGFPRMTRREDGAIVSSPANLPSVLLLPRPGRVSMARLSDVLTVSLLLLVSGYWFVRRRRGAA